MKYFKKFLLILILFSFFINLSCAKNLNHSTKNIYIYLDDGISPLSAFSVFSALKKAHYHNIYFIDAQNIINSNWDKHSDLLIMPGGADTPYVKKLANKGYQKIRNFVKKGGSYLGICAGAYFAANNIIFKTKDIKITGKRLDLYHGKAQGPITQNYDPNSHKDALSLVINNSFFSYYNGGCFFKKNDVLKNNFKILAFTRYLKNNYIMAIFGKYHKGRVLLTCIHPEIRYNNIKYLDLKQSIKNNLKKSNQKLESFWQELILKLY